MEQIPGPDPLARSMAPIHGPVPRRPMDQIPGPGPHGPDPWTRPMNRIHGSDPWSGSGWLQFLAESTRSMDQVHGTNPWTRCMDQIRGSDSRPRGLVPRISSMEHIHRPDAWTKSMDRICGQDLWTRIPVCCCTSYQLGNPYHYN